MRIILLITAFTVVGCVRPSTTPSPSAAKAKAAALESEGEARLPAGVGRYEDLVEIVQAFRALSGPSERLGLDDYRAATVTAKLSALEALRVRLEDSNVRAWPTDKQVDFVLVRSMFDQYEFLLRVARPWARDPGFYVDRLYRPAFTTLPAEGEQLDMLKASLAEIANTLAAAREDLTDVATDYAALARYNLTHADGVGHGHPYRAEPPPGVLGWYADLRARAEAQQPELLPAIDGAFTAIADFERWLSERTFTGQAGVGRRLYDWYLKHVKLMPFTSAQLKILAAREIERLESALVLERHHNRRLPLLEPAGSAQDYEARIRDADRDVRAWIVNESILTLPDDIGELDTNAPWIVRPTGRNFWEEIQFRDPRPDHVHAVIPGHRFDWKISERQVHPIRQKYWDAGRVEGWAVYLEEMAMRTGLLDQRPRTKELFWIFGLKRATRVIVDVDMQLNEKTVPEAVSYMMARVPFLDEAVARVDAEIYIRRPPGYGLSYTIGKLQIDRLLAKRARQLGKDFKLKRFHDTMLSLGRIPVALLAWQMTGDSAEAERFWRAKRLSEVLTERQ